jgi:hypothetical protein
MTRFAALLSTWLLGSPEPGRHHGIGQASEQIGIARHLIRHQFAEPGDLATLAITETELTVGIAEIHGVTVAERNKRKPEQGTGPVVASQCRNNGEHVESAWVGWKLQNWAPPAAGSTWIIQTPATQANWNTIELEPPDGGFVQVEGSVGAVRQFTPDK